ncbi:hypothetical protein [Streptomyces sp. NPDC054787]
MRSAASEGEDSRSSGWRPATSRSAAGATRPAVAASRADVHGGITTALVVHTAIVLLATLTTGPFLPGRACRQRI